MHSLSLLTFGAFFSAFFSYATAFITIIGPDPNHWWVQNTSNTIFWVYETGAPDSVSIVIRNANDDSLNGQFSIVENVPTASESYEVTYVTLKVATGYYVEFVNPQNESQPYDLGPEFEVKAPGSPSANITDLQQEVLNSTHKPSSIVGTATNTASSTSSSSGPSHLPQAPPSGALTNMVMGQWKLATSVTGLLVLGTGLLI